ncbi:hypothetical protein FACS189485_17670 [Spirochaetia bacterium]|nr:hypothetical protein FACS189485_17670 [Spirochaetia bacterium]
MKFEWYSEKERINIEKHGIDLEMVKQAFDDPFRVEQYDEAHSELEDRWQTLGMSGDVLFVVYTERGETCRIITAREAEPEERRIYYGESSKGNWFIP